jgi:hypothetical protein
VQKWRDSRLRGRRGFAIAAASSNRDADFRGATCQNACIFRAANVVDRDDVSLVQARNRSRLGFKALAARSICGELLGKDLYRHFAIQSRIACAIDFAPAA